MKLKGITIAIPTLGRSPHLKELLNSINHQHVKNFEVEVLVLPQDNFSQVIKIVSRAQMSGLKIKQIDLPQKNVNRARNKAAELSSHDLMYFLDDDCILSRPDHLERMITQTLQNPQVDCIGGGYSTEHEGFYWSTLYNTVVKLWGLQNQIKNECQLMPAGNLLIKRNVLLKHPFANHLTRGGEESAWLLFIQKMGYKTKFIGDLSVSHKCENSFWHVYKKAFTHGQAKAKLSQRPIQEKSRLSLSEILPHTKFRQIPFLFLYYIIDQIGFWSQYLKTQRLVHYEPASKL